MSALTSPRNFSRYTTGGFDGVTQESAVFTQLRSEWTTPTDSVVGVWSPTALQRTAGDPLAPSIASICRVALEGTVNPGDLVSVLDSTNAIRFSYPASAEGTPFFFLGPQDSVAIRADDATKADILVQDLTAQNLPWWLIADATAQNIPINPSPYSEVTLTLSPSPVPAWTGRLMAFVDLGASGDVVLPALGDVALGDTVTFLRVPGSAIARVITDTPASDEVNGLVTSTDNQYYLRDTAQSVQYMRVSGGWQRRAGLPVAGVVSATLSPTSLAAFQEGTLYVADTMPANGVLNLPLLADCTEGCKIVIRTNFLGSPTGFMHVLTALGGDTINGTGTTFRYTAVTSNSIVVVEHAGTTWNVTTNIAETTSFRSVVAPAVLSAAGGSVYVDINLAGNGDITLPDPLTVPAGTAYHLIRTAGAGMPRIITDNALTEVNGVAGITATQWFLTSIGKCVTYIPGNGGWIREQEWDQQQTQTLNAAGAIDSVPGELIVLAALAAPALITLPDITTVPLGARILIYRSGGAGLPTIVCDDALDTVNGITAAGGNSWFLSRVGESVEYVAVLGGWYRSAAIAPSASTSAGAINATTARTQYYEMTGAAGQDLILPAITTVDVGTMIWMFNNSGNSHDIVPNGADLIDGVIATLPITGPSKTLIVSYGATLGWVTLTGA